MTSVPYARQAPALPDAIEIDVVDRAGMMHEPVWIEVAGGKRSCRSGDDTEELVLADAVVLGRRPVTFMSGARIRAMTLLPLPCLAPGHQPLVDLIATTAPVE